MQGTEGETPEIHPHSRVPTRIRQVLAALALGVVVALGGAALAAVSSYSGRILTETSYSSTAAITSNTLQADGNTVQLTYVIYSTQAGSAVVYYKGFGNEGVAIDSAVSVSASTAKVITVYAGLPSTYVVFTPSAATAGTVWIDGIVTTGPRRTRD